MEQVNIGLIGCGSFARGMHVPILQKMNDVRICATMDIEKDAAESLAAQVGADYATDDVGRVLSDPGVDAVIITTRHDSHAQLCVAAARAGKHILCEKPMALSAREVGEVVKAVRAAGVKYTVGYNRGLAPCIQRAKEMIAPLGQKKMIYHRIQAYFPESHWTHLREVGGGRFVGEGCHIFDLLCELVGQPPVRVYAAGSTFLNPDIVKIPDSAAVTLTFADGSVGTTLIDSAGCPSFAKEATEIYCDRKAIYIDMFKNMDCYGFMDGVISYHLSAEDKGHASELRGFVDAIRNNTEAPNGLLKAARAAILSYKVDESIATGLPVSISAEEYTF